MLAGRVLTICMALGWLLVGPGVETVCAQFLDVPPAAAIHSTSTEEGFKKGSGTVVRSTRPTFGRCRAVGATVPDPFLNQEEYFFECPPPVLDQWTWQVLPEGLIYPAYLAAGRESRIASQWMHESSGDSFWDITLGGRVGMIRYGNRDPLLPEGLQIDIEGAGFPRLTLDSQRDLVAVDFRFGVPITFRFGKFETKLAYYHLSSHLGDEYLEKNPGAVRINYARDVLVLGLAVRPHDDWRLYAEAGWAGYVSGGSEPWEFQFGVDYSPLRPTSFRGAPFFAVNGRIRQEVDFGGNLTAQIGWQWRGETGHLCRFGFHYFNGKTDLYQFFREHEEQFAIGLWYDY